MAKASPLQPSFSGGEFSPRVFGRVDNERYRTGLATCLNYLPTVQGPIIRRPGMQYVADVKDPSSPPALIPFQFSRTQNYILEFGSSYIRFHTGAGQVLATGSSYQVNGFQVTDQSKYEPNWTNGEAFGFWSSRPNLTPRQFEVFAQSTVFTDGQVLEIGSPYGGDLVHGLKWVQKKDVLYLFHPNAPIFKLLRYDATEWKLMPVYLRDGPYLPYNTYETLLDLERFNIGGVPPSAAGFGAGAIGRGEYTTGPTIKATAMVANSTGEIRVTVASHPYQTGDKVFIGGSVGTTEANNGSSVTNEFWTVKVVGATQFDLVGSVFANGYTGSATIWPAIFVGQSLGQLSPHRMRNIAFINGGTRYWGTIVNDGQGFVGGGHGNPSKIHIEFWDRDQQTIPTGSSSVFQLGVYALNSSGYPSCGCFHQNRLVLGGSPGAPQQINASMTADYETFSLSASSLVVTDNNALQFDLEASDINAIRWLKSDANGLLAGSENSEFMIAPNNQAAALTPTNINATAPSSFGSADKDAVKAGNAVLYIDQASQKVRELNYFFQVNTYRSTDLAELSEHLAKPALTKIVGQNNKIPIVWGLRSDGTILSMLYSRDDQSLRVGWARHELGGQSDSAGTPPVTTAISVIPSTDGTFDQLWAVTRRFINGTSVVQIERMAKDFEASDLAEDACVVDLSATYDSPKTITSISNGGSSIVTSAAHGFSDGDLIQITGVVGLGSSVTDLMGVVHTSSLVNYRTFRVASTSTNAFFLTSADNGSSYVDGRGYGSYVGSGYARKYVSTITGLTWLKNETVSVWADGGAHPDVVVNSAGVIALDYPVVKAQVGYSYNSDAKTLRLDAGSADGSAIGKIRRPVRAAFMIYRSAELQIGTDMNRLTPLEFNEDAAADTAPPLFTGIKREGLESEYDFEGQICMRQSGPGPGMIQAVNVMLEENDV